MRFSSILKTTCTLNLLALFFFVPSCSSILFHKTTALNPIRHLIRPVPKINDRPGVLKRQVQDVLVRARSAVARIGSQDASKLTFESTFKAFDDVSYQVRNLRDWMSLVAETHPSEAVRKEAEPLNEQLSQWLIQLNYNERIYRALSRFLEGALLNGEEKRLADETMQDFRRAGMLLSSKKRKNILDLRQQIVALELQFLTNIREATANLSFTRTDLEGVPEPFLATKIHDKNGTFIINANNPVHFTTVIGTAKKESTRRLLQLARFDVAKESNLALLKKLIADRSELARKLGYPTWADYQLENKMAKRLQTVNQFIRELAEDLDPKFRAEISAMQKLKAEETQDPAAKVYYWDIDYYSEAIRRRDQNINTEDLRVYFSLPTVLRGMFDVFETVFGIKITEVDAVGGWAPEVQLYKFTDAKTGSPLGLMYFDPFPRPGKYGHIAQFDIIAAKQLRPTEYQHPTLALVCNFPPPEKETPSLLRPSDVEALFHELGHALHGILSTAKYVRLSAADVPRDFIEVPSQTIQRWAMQPDVLRRFTVDYRDASKSLPADIIQKLQAARNATAGVVNRRGLALAMLDMKIHSGRESDPAQVAMDSFRKLFLPIPKTGYPARFSHMAENYDAGYYGYAWADIIAADLNNQFETAPKGFLDSTMGERLRLEVLSQGNMRDASESIQAFLGHPPSRDAFLRQFR